MKGFLFWGLVCGKVCIGAYVVVAITYKKKLILAQAIELLLSGSGLLGGIKLCWLVLSGELSKMIEARPAQIAPSIVPEDVIYFFVGGVALIWLSVESIAKHLRASSAHSANGS